MPDSSLRAAKAELRARMTALRDALPAAWRAEADHAITQRLLSRSEWAGARVVFAYVSFRSEVSTRAILSAALESGRTLLVPRVHREGRRMVACRIHSLGELVPGDWGILEPAAATEVEPGQIDLIVTPGLAFDRQGMRLGYGAGYYDRFLRSVRPDCVRFGLAFEAQLLSAVPAGADDERVSGVITEADLYHCDG